MKIAAFIPARKGSKRIPGKNRIDIDGDYLINKVIRNIKKSLPNIDIYISSDDEEFIELIEDKDVNFLKRESRFSDDFSTVTDLTKSHYEKDLQNYDLIIQAFCHSICVSGDNYSDALKKIMDSNKNSLITIARLDGPVEWTFKIINDKLVPNFPEKKSERSQDLGFSFIDAGQFYIYKKEWLKEENLDNYNSESEWIELNYFQSNDLDEESDLSKLKINYEVAKDNLKNLD
jgi:CMP-N-acetylneuraminic acid synthetase